MESRDIKNILNIDYLPDLKVFENNDVLRENVYDLFLMNIDKLTYNESIYFEGFLNDLHIYKPRVLQKIKEHRTKKAKNIVNSSIKDEMTSYINSFLKGQTGLDVETIDLLSELKNIYKNEDISQYNLVDFLNKHIESCIKSGNESSLDEDEADELESEYYRIMQSNVCYPSDIERLVELSKLLNKRFTKDDNNRLISIYSRYHKLEVIYKIDYSEHIKLVYTTEQKISNIIEQLLIQTKVAKSDLLDATRLYLRFKEGFDYNDNRIEYNSMFLFELVEEIYTRCVELAETYCKLIKMLKKEENRDLHIKKVDSFIKDINLLYNDLHVNFETDFLFYTTNIMLPFMPNTFKEKELYERKEDTSIERIYSQKVGILKYELVFKNIIKKLIQVDKFNGLLLNIRNNSKTLDQLYPNNIKVYQFDDEEVDDTDRTLVKSFLFDYYMNNTVKRLCKVERNVEQSLEARRMRDYILDYTIILLRKKENVLFLEDINKMDEKDIKLTINYNDVFCKTMSEKIPSTVEILKKEENLEYYKIAQRIGRRSKQLSDAYFKQTASRELEMTLDRYNMSLKELNNEYTKYMFSYKVHLDKYNCYYSEYLIKERLFLYLYLPVFIRMLQHKGYTIILLCDNTPEPPFYNIYRQLSRRKNSCENYYIYYDQRSTIEIKSCLPSRYRSLIVDGDYSKCIQIHDLDFKIMIAPKCRNYVLFTDMHLSLFPVQYYYSEKMMETLLDQIYYKRHDFILRHLTNSLSHLIQGTYIKECKIHKFLEKYLNIPREYYKKILSYNQLDMTPDIYFVDLDNNFVFISELGVSDKLSYLQEKEDKYKVLIDLLQKNITKFKFVYVPILFHTIDFKFICRKDIEQIYINNYDRKYDILNRRTYLGKSICIDAINLIKDINHSFMNSTILYKPRLKNIEGLKVLNESLSKIDINTFSEKDFGDLHFYYKEYVHISKKLETEFIGKGLITPHKITNDIVKTKAAEDLYKLIDISLSKNKVEPISYNEFIPSSDNIDRVLLRVDQYNKSIKESLSIGSLGCKPKRIESLFFVPFATETTTFVSGSNSDKIKSFFKYLNTFTITKIFKSSESKLTIDILSNFIKKMQIEDIYNKIYIQQYGTERKNIIIDSVAPKLLSIFTKKDTYDRYTKVSKDDKYSLSFSDITIDKVFDILSKRKISDTNIFENLSNMIPDIENHKYFQEEYLSMFQLYKDSMSILSYNLYLISNFYYNLSFTLDNVVSVYRKRTILHTGYQSNIVYILNKGSSQTKKNAKYKVSALICTSLDYLYLYKAMFTFDSLYYLNDNKTVLIITNPITFNYNTSYQMRLLFSQMMIESFYAFTEYNGSIEEKQKYSEKIQKLVFCANRLFDSTACKFLSDVRYLVSIFSSGIFDLDLILKERFPKNIHSYPFLYIYKQFISNLGIILSDNFYDVAYSGKLYKISSYGIFTGVKLSTYDLVLLEQYLTKLTFKEHKEKVHAIKETLETIKEYQKTDHHHFDTKVIFETGRLIKSYYPREYINNIFIKGCDSRLINHIKSTSSLHIQNPDSETNYIRQHLSDAIIDKIHVKNNTELTLADVLDSSKEKYIQISSSVKEETKGYRETNVTSLETLVGLKIIDIMSLELNKLMGIDDICNEGDKKFIRYQEMVNQVFDTYSIGNQSILRSSNDGKKWSTGDDIITEYITFGSIFTNYSYDSLLEKFYEQQGKPITYYSSIIDKILWIIAAIASRHLLKDDNNKLFFSQIFNTEKDYAVLRYGWPEGYFNSLSSLKHALSYIASSIYLHYYSMKSDQYISFFYRVHSDDSVHAIIGKNNEDLVSCDIIITKIKSLFQSICNKTKDIKTFKIYTIQEYLSNFNILKSLIPARIIHGISIEKDLSGLSYYDDIMSMCARLDEGLRYGLGNYWYQLAIRLSNDFVARSHRMIDKMKNSYTLINKYYLPEEFGGYYYTSPIVFFNTSTVGNHIRLLYLNNADSLSLLKYIYTLDSDDSGVLTKKGGIKPHLYVKPFNREVLKKILPIQEIENILSKVHEYMEVNNTFYALNSEDKFNLVVSQIWGKSGTLSYSKNKNYSVITSKLTYKNFNFYNESFNSIDDLIDKKTHTIISFHDMSKIIYSTIATKEKLIKYLISKPISSITKTKIDFSNCEIRKISILSERDNDAITHFKNINLKTENTEDLRNALTNFLGVKLDKMKIIRFLKKLENTEKYLYINFPIETDVIDKLNNYMYLGFLYPNYEVNTDIFSIESKIVENLELNDDVYQKHIVFNMTNILSLISIFTYVNNKEYIPDLRTLHLFLTRVYNVMKRDEYTKDPYKFLNNFIKTVNLDILVKNTERFALRSMYDLNNILLTGKNTLKFSIDFPIYYNLDSKEYYIKFADAKNDNDISLRLSNGQLLIFGLHEEDTYLVRKDNGDIDTFNSLKVEISETVAKLIFAYHGKKLENFDNNIDSLIEKASFDYINLSDIDDELGINESTGIEFSIYKETEKIYIGYANRRHKRKVLLHYQFCNYLPSISAPETYKKKQCISYNNKDIRLSISNYLGIPTITYKTGDLLYYYRPFYFGFQSAYPLYDTVIFNSPIKDLIFTDIKFNDIAELSLISQLRIVEEYNEIPIFNYHIAHKLYNVKFISNDVYDNKIMTKADQVLVSIKENMVIKRKNVYYSQMKLNLNSKDEVAEDDVIKLNLEDLENNNIIIETKEANIDELKNEIDEENIHEKNDIVEKISISSIVNSVNKFVSSEFKSISIIGMKAPILLSLLFRTKSFSYSTKQKIKSYLYLLSLLHDKKLITINYNLSIIIIFMFILLNEEIDKLDFVDKPYVDILCDTPTNLKLDYLQSIDLIERELTIIEISDFIMINRKESESCKPSKLLKDIEYACEIEETEENKYRRERDKIDTSLSFIRKGYLESKNKEVELKTQKESFEELKSLILESEILKEEEDRINNSKKKDTINTINNNNLIIDNNKISIEISENEKNNNKVSSNNDQKNEEKEDVKNNEVIEFKIITSSDEENLK